MTTPNSTTEAGVTAAQRLRDALELIVNCEAFAEPFANAKHRDPADEAQRQQRIEDVLSAGQRAIEAYDAAQSHQPSAQGGERVDAAALLEAGRAAGIGAALEALHTRLQYPTEACAIVRALYATPPSAALATPSPAQAEPTLGIPKATLFHDAGAIAQCGACKRYTLDVRALGDRQPTCTCGEKHYWSGSFKSPGPDAQWHGSAPTGAAEGAEPTADAERLNAIQTEMWFVEPQYQDGTWRVGKADRHARPTYSGKTLRAAIDAARAAQKGRP